MGGAKVERSRREDRGAGYGVRRGFPLLLGRGCAPLQNFFFEFRSQKFDLWYILRSVMTVKELYPGWFGFGRACFLYSTSDMIFNGRQGERGHGPLAQPGLSLNQPLQTDRETKRHTDRETGQSVTVIVIVVVVKLIFHPIHCTAVRQRRKWLIRRPTLDRNFSRRNYCVLYLRSDSPTGGT